MSKSPTESRLNAHQFSLRQLFLWIHIVAVACSAFVGIGQILVGFYYESRVLVTAVIIALASVCGLGCGAALEGKRAKIFPVAGMVLTLLGTLMLLFIVWIQLPWQRSMEGFVRWTAIFCIYAVACSHISLLSIARLSERFRWAIFVAVISILAVASLVSAPMVFHDAFAKNMSLLIRYIAVAAIIDAAMSVLIPVFHLLSRGEMKALNSGVELTLADIDAEIAQLESRLVKLRQSRMEKYSDDGPAESYEHSCGTASKSDCSCATPSPRVLS